MLFWRRLCKHRSARLHSVQRLAGVEPVELWHCPTCKSTISAEAAGKSHKPAAAT